MPTLRDAVEIAILDVTGDADFTERVGNCVDILLEEHILTGSESATEAIKEIILQGIAEGQP